LYGPDHRIRIAGRKGGRTLVYPECVRPLAHVRSAGPVGGLRKTVVEAYRTVLDEAYLGTFFGYGPLHSGGCTVPPEPDEGTGLSRVR